MATTERDNWMQWKGGPGHYEVWYATFNHRASRSGFWIRYTLGAPATGAAPYCQLWFAAFDGNDPRRNVAVNQRFPIERLEASREPFRVALAGAELTHGALRGELPATPEPVSWDLRYEPGSVTHRHLPAAVYDSPMFDSRVLSPALMSHFTGTVTVGERTFELDQEPGCQTHLWGRRHAHAWAWGHCNAFREDPTACLELLTVKLRKGGIVTPPLTLLSLYLGSEVYRFGEFYMLPLTRGRWETGLYRFAATGARVKITGELRCRPEDLVRATYADPDGDAVFCHNTEVADARLTVFTRRSPASRFRRLCRLTAQKSAHMEYAARTPDGRVEREHRTL